jgi:hypothetical protein
MPTEDHSLSAQVDLALANAKRAQREARIVVRDIARIRDAIEANVQSEEDTTNE